MKRFLSAIIIISLVTCSIGMPAFADDPMKKLGRGVSNVFLSPMELLKGIGDANVEHGWFAAGTWGFLQGLVKGGIRAVVGVYEVVTFPIPLPKGYGPILTDPEFFFEDVN